MELELVEPWLFLDREQFATNFLAAILDRLPCVFVFRLKRWLSDGVSFVWLCSFFLLTCACCGAYCSFASSCSRSLPPFRSTCSWCRDVQPWPSRTRERSMSLNCQDKTRQGLYGNKNGPNWGKHRDRQEKTALPPKQPESSCSSVQSKLRTAAQKSSHPQTTRQTNDTPAMRHQR